MKKPRFYIDEQIIEQFTEALLTSDKSEMLRVVDMANDRLEGRCFCSATSSSECTCGAWGTHKEQPKVTLYCWSHVAGDWFAYAQFDTVAGVENFIKMKGYDPRYCKYDQQPMP
jgi:hypothetical protein